MREILFRGKRIDNGEWIRGDLITTPFIRNTTQQNIIYILDVVKADYDCFEDLVEDNRIFEVDTETVCQCTGYTDLRQKKVFEHDVVFYEDGGCCGHIVFKEGRFSIEWEGARPDLRSDIHFWFENRRMYVTGNIFDNPELAENDA